MNAYLRRRFATIQHTAQFILDHPVQNALAISLLADLQAFIAQIETIAAQQGLGRALMLASAGRRQDIAEDLRSAMRDLARVARVLDPREFPDVAATMRTANLKVYSELVARARAFISIARPLAATFIAYGAPENFIARMESQIAALDAAEGRKYTGRNQWIGKTVALAEAIRQAMRIVRKLQAILNVLYRPNPGLAAAWKAATHIERAPKRSTQATSSMASSDERDFAERPDHQSRTTSQSEQSTFAISSGASCKARIASNYTPVPKTGCQATGGA